MSIAARYLEKEVRSCLEERMAFLGGPRQVGKTTLALHLLGATSPRHPAYLNWDAPGVPQRLRQGELPLGQGLLILDEIHKYRHWRNLVKGLFDTHRDAIKFLITGSARLDHYRRGGDSLLGRYRYFRLHPFSVGELQLVSQEELQRLLRFGGFPEVYLKASDTAWRLWQRERITKLVREDLRDLEQVRELSLIEQLAEELPRKVGSPLSIVSLREDLLVDHKTVVRWITILENLYYCFRIAPYGPPKIRAVKKEQKLYLWDWSTVKEPGPRFENLVACQLLKYCHWIEDTQGHHMELRYLRDVQRREIDFVVLKDAAPMFAVECKLSDREVDRSLLYFQDRTDIPVFYMVHLEERSFRKGKIQVLPFVQFCQQLHMP